MMEPSTLRRPQDAVFSLPPHRLADALAFHVTADAAAISFNDLVKARDEGMRSSSQR